MNLIFHKKIADPCNLYICLYIFYMVLSANVSNSITGGLLLLINLISFYYFLQVVTSYKQPRLLKWLSILILLFSIYGVIHIASDVRILRYGRIPVSNTDFIKAIGTSLLPVYPFFVFTKRGFLNSAKIKFWIPIFITVSIYLFLHQYQVMREQAIQNGAFKVTEFTNNLGYLFVSILPLVFLRQKNQIIQYAYIGVCLIFIVQGIKRGAILTGSLAILYYIYENIKATHGSKRIRFLFITIAAMMIAGNFIIDFISESDYFSTRIKRTIAGDSSSRDVIYEALWSVFLNSNLIQILFGHGADSTIFFTNMHAHNDWLEILTNMGILGISIYLIYFVVMLKMAVQYRNNTTFGICLGGLFITLLLPTLFSMGYTQYTLFTCVAYGYCMGKISILKK